MPTSVRQTNQKSPAKSPTPHIFEMNPTVSLVDQKKEQSQNV